MASRGTIEHLGPTGIHQRQEVDVEVALHPLSGAGLDPQLLERLCHPCAPIAITLDVADAVRPEHLDELSHHALRLERWLHLADQIEKHAARGRVLVGDGEREAVGAAATRISEGDVLHVSQGWQLVPPAHDHGIECLARELAFGIGRKRRTRRLFEVSIEDLDAAA